jgi:fructose-specific component phosphotransferase system IIB-like protein
VISLAYLADVFGSVNSVNISLQGKKMTILEDEEKVQSSQEKLTL